MSRSGVDHAIAPVKLKNKTSLNLVEFAGKNSEDERLLLYFILPFGRECRLKCNFDQLSIFHFNVATYRRLPIFVKHIHKSQLKEKQTVNFQLKFNNALYNWP